MIALVTGARSGIGYAIADKIAEMPHIGVVLAVSRSIKPSDVSHNPKLIAVAADVSTEAGRETIVDHVKQYQPQKLRYLVHNAGTIEPIKPVLEVTESDLRGAMTLNCEAPLLLTTALYPFMSSDDTPGRVLHVSSGAAHGAPPVGWSVYGVSKAAFFQSYKVLHREFGQLGGKVIVGSFKPGVVDTPMQNSIRESPDSAMPAVSNFRSMKEKVAKEDLFPRPPPKGALDSPRNVAFFAEWLLTGTTNEEFANSDALNEYDIRDESLFHRWITNQAP